MWPRSDAAGRRRRCTETVPQERDCLVLCRSHRGYRIGGTLLAAGADVNGRTPPDEPKNSSVGDTMLVTAIANGHFALADHPVEQGRRSRMRQAHAGRRCMRSCVSATTRNRSILLPRPRMAIWTALELASTSCARRGSKRKGRDQDSATQPGRHELHGIQRGYAILSGRKGG